MQRILVCLDHSATAERILRAAADLARRTNARLVLFHAVGVPSGVPAEAWAVPPDRLPEILLEASRRELGALADTHAPGLVERSIVNLGAPWRAVVDAAREVDADLIVIGSHGYGGIDRLLGTTAAKIVNHADRSVLVVRDPERLS